MYCCILKTVGVLAGRCRNKDRKEGRKKGRKKKITYHDIVLSSKFFQSSWRYQTQKSMKVRHYKFGNENFGFKEITHTYSHIIGLNFSIISVMCQQFFCQWGNLSEKVLINESSSEIAVEMLKELSMLAQSNLHLF